MSVVNYKLNGAIGVISINNPPVNVLSLAVRTGVQEAIIAAQNDESKAIVLICDGRTFIAGADITEFGKTPLFTSEELASAGVDIMLFPLSAFRAMNKAAESVYQDIAENGTQKKSIELMQTRDELYEYLNYHSFEQKLDELFKSKENK